MKTKKYRPPTPTYCLVWIRSHDSGLHSSTLGSRRKMGKTFHLRDAIFQDGLKSCNVQKDEGEVNEDVEISTTSPARRPISFSISNVVAKPSRSPTLHGTESKVTSRADSVGNGMPYGKWIPVKKVSTKKR
ncbi:hypothetical protein KOW79_002835 [Hemibagrus wyckioides]|uniref:Uncharacterized protein n=1 Tax=Hemibagrus wyckioides TaxID=337641 RepID=A0A9D3SX68_9TELE|nr:hypothetical protein KOW79_002835 [Hemibagrus wyckioides]